MSALESYVTLGFPIPRFPLLYVNANWGWEDADVHEVFFEKTVAFYYGCETTIEVVSHLALPCINLLYLREVTQYQFFKFLFLVVRMQIRNIHEEPTRAVSCWGVAKDNALVSRSLGR